jgi:hypothetical protein
MQGKIMFVLGAAAGYVIGTRRGRQGYEQLKRQASEAWQNPRVQSTVQKTVENVEQFAKDKVPAVAPAVSKISEKLSANIDGSSGEVPASGTTSPEATNA